MYNFFTLYVCTTGCSLIGEEERGLTSSNPQRTSIATTNHNHLETLVVLEELLGGTGRLVVLVTDDAGVEHPRGGVEGVHGRVDTELRDLTRKHLWYLSAVVTMRAEREKTAQRQEG